MTDTERIQRLERLVLFVVHNAEFTPGVFSGPGARMMQEDLAGVTADLKREMALDPPAAKA